MTGCVSEGLSASSANIQTEAHVYHDIERLELKGLLKSEFLSTKPFGRLEALRLLKEAEDGLAGLDDGERAEAEELITRLKKRLEGKGAESGSYARPG